MTTKTERQPQIGDLRVWWIPQIPMTAFHVKVKDVDQAKFLLDALAFYDLFQLKHNIKPDYSNVGGLEVCTKNYDDASLLDWEEWENEDGDCIDDIGVEI